MKKIYILLFILLFPIINLNAVSSDDVDYDVDGIYINGQIEIAGAVRFREIIKISGTYNGYIRDLVYKNDRLDHFTGTKENFSGSAIYNGSGIIIHKVGILNTEDFNYDDFSEEYINKNVTFFKNETNNSYQVSNINNGKSIKLFNETVRGVTYFYIEYTITDLIVEHNDYAEFYYNIIGENFDDDIEEVQAIVYLPFQDEKNLRVWAHGPLTGNAHIIEGGYGAMLSIEKLNSNTSIDLRMLFSKEQFMINLNNDKKSNMDALPIILEIEEKRANEANEQRERAKVLYYIVLTGNILYLIGIVGASIFVYKKYDKEYKSSFTNRYNREFIEDYDVEVVDYLMNLKTITPNAFSASILNLVYKKKIKVEKIEGKKEDYSFLLIDKEGISEAEEKIIDLLFIKIGSNNLVKMSEIKSASKASASNNRVYDTFMSWKEVVKSIGTNQGFFETNIKIKVLFSLYAILGFLFGVAAANIGISFVAVIVIVISLLFLVYILAFSKRSIKGNEHYVKWKAFKRFLEDFGRFEEKELPEIVLWERYLVYATVFGIADKVSKVMKVKFEEMNINNTSYGNPWFDYYVFTNISRDLNKGITNSINNSISTVNAANSSSSSGSGFGGGFSSGGGFGGGGGGGRGF